MTTTKHALRLNGHHQRNDKSRHPSRVRPGGHLPTADRLAEVGASPELVAQVQRWHDLVTAERDHARKAAAANVAVTEAAQSYRREVRETIADGGDPAKVKDQTARHHATAAAHVQFSVVAQAERERLGAALGLLVEDAAPALFPAAETAIDYTATHVRAALVGVRETWRKHSDAFQLRAWLSHVHLDGGDVPSFHGASGLPAAAEAALAALDHAIEELDRLKADEAEVTRWRRQEQAAKDHGARTYGSN